MRAASLGPRSSGIQTPLLQHLRLVRKSLDDGHGGPSRSPNGEARALRLRLERGSGRFGDGGPRDAAGARWIPGAPRSRMRRVPARRGGHGRGARRRLRSRSFARSRRAVVRADPGRSGRRGGQGRTAGRRRRHPRLGAALPEGPGRRRHDRGGLLSRRQQGQAVDRARHLDRRRRPRRARAGVRGRRRHRKLQARWAGEIRPRLRQPQGAQPRARLLLDHRLRPDRTLRPPGRLRFRAPGLLRLHVDHGRTRRPARRRAAEGGRGDRRPHDGTLQRHRHPRRPQPPRQDGRRPAHRHGAGRQRHRAHGQHEHELPRQRRFARTLRQRASEPAALRGVRHRRRSHHPRHRQRRPVPPLGRAGGRAGPGRRRAFRDQPGAHPQPRGADRNRRRPDEDAAARVVGGEPRATLHPLRRGQRLRAGLRRSPRPGPGA